MRWFRGRVSAVTALVVVVLLLVPALAWLQYRWVGQVSEAERERMQRTLRTAAGQFATDFDGELSRAVVGLQVEGSVLRDENWTSYAQRYSSWSERADPRLVREVLIVDAMPGVDGSAADLRPEQLRVRRWMPDARVFAPTEWVDDLAPMRGTLAEHLGEVRVLRGQGGRFRRDSMAFALADDYTLVSPVTLFDFGDDRRAPPRIEISGFTLVRIDPQFVRNTLLPSLTARHFLSQDGEADYRIAVTERDTPASVVWESVPGAAAAMGPSSDVSVTFMSPRPDQIMMIARNGSADRRGGPAPPPPPPGPDGEDRVVISVLQDRRVAADDRAAGDRGRGFGPFEGRWRLAAAHRSGSLEAAVAAVRTRNLMLSSSILLLLTTAIGLIVVSARRAQTLARQQMEFVAAVSHELRTPVSVIGTAASNLADGVVADPARVRKYGETIQGEARRLGETVERVLQLAGIAAGGAAASRGPVDVGTLVQQSLAACRSEIEAKGVQVEVQVPDGLRPVEGDAAALRSAVQNLISNAVKYGGEARWLRVSATPASRRNAASPGLPVRRSEPEASPYVAITVADRGLGITADDRKHVFEPFYRGREAVSRQIQGSGLGLNLVARIAEAHGGKVDVTSEPGKGSTFTLILPTTTSDPAARLEAATSLPDLQINRSPNR
jgi:signal transduction histidine kinase